MVLDSEEHRTDDDFAGTLAPPHAVHLRDYLAVVLKNIKVVVALAVLALTLAVLYLFSQEPRYRATAEIEVSPGVSSEKLSPTYITPTAWQKKLNTYRQILTGPTLAGRVVDRLGVDSYAALGIPTPEPGVLDHVQDWIKSVVPTTKESSDASRVPEKVLYRKALREHLEVELVPDTNIIELSYTCGESDAAERVCDTVAQQFIESQQERRMDAAERAVGLLRKHQQEFEKKVTSLEEKLIEIREEMDFLPSSVEGNEERLSALNETIATLTSARAEAQVKRVKLEAAYNSVSNRQMEGNPIPISIQSSWFDSSALKSLRIQYHQVQRDLAAARTKYGDKHSRIKELKTTLEMIREDMESELEHAKKALGLSLEEARDEEEKLAQELEQAKQRVTSINKKMAEYSMWKRKAETNRQLFDVLSEEAKKMDVVGKMQSLNIHVITNPEVTRAPLHAIRLLVLALLGGLAAGVGLAFFLDYMDTSISTPADLENAVPADALGVVFSTGGRKGSPILPAVRAPGSTVSENFRNLRTGVLYSPQFADTRFIVVTSSVAQEGKTSVTANLAVLLAQAGKRVLLVDGDIRKPGIDGLFGLNRKPGLSDFLRGKTSLDEVMRRVSLAELMAAGGEAKKGRGDTDDEAMLQPVVENLAIITCGTNVSDPSELIGSAAEPMKELMACGQQEFDTVLIDTPPMTLSDPYLLAKTTGAAVLLVVKSGGPGSDVVRRVVGKLKSVDADIGGTVLNQFDIRKEGYYGYGYGYYDYYYHHYYYAYGERAGGKERREAGSPEAT